MIRATVRPLKDGYSFISFSPRLAMMYRALKRPGKNDRKDKIQCAYFGFETEQQAKTFVTYLKEKHSSIRTGVREGERLSECAWEVKVWEFDGLLELIHQCARKAQQPAAA
jgi:hypothetical protein